MLDGFHDWVSQYEDDVYCIAGAYTGAEFEKAAQEIRNHMYTGNTDSLRGLYRQKLATNQICKFEIEAAFFWLCLKRCLGVVMRNDSPLADKGKIAAHDLLGIHIIASHQI